MTLNPSGIDLVVRVSVSQIGARRHYAVPVALYRAGLLDSLHTDWCANRGIPRVLTNWLPAKAATGRLRRLRDRLIPEVPRRMIETHTWHAARMSYDRRSRSLSNEAYWAHANAAFGRSVVERGFGKADAVYGFNAAAVEIFEAGRQNGLRTVLDQTMASWQSVEQILSEERQRWPDWESDRTERATSGILVERESQEWSNADLIICGSEYVANSIAESGGPSECCRVVPYGYDGPTLPVSEKPISSGPLRVLFVGTVDLRKGVPYLLEAARQFERRSVEFRVVGPLQVAESIVPKLREHVNVVGPVPRSAVAEHYCWADVFLLPTLAEGSANVCYEAMAHRLPVITTPNAGSVVRDQIDGWIIPIRSSDAIVDCIQQLTTHRDRVAEAAHHAQQRAHLFTWDRYMQVLGETISGMTDRSSSSESPPIAH